MNGATARMQGYAAWLGFGITRIMNQIVETNPMSIKKLSDFKFFMALLGFHYVG